ncbi:hypothetical protein BASA50_002031 [Batrachochytrium salamandrivorans]|uniref:Uncharacterized protein n=1 Tax=Batrachochytrium salamandrivorans TaxID=1357716 RepID=A0ABQ8FMF8_9FUNG|nr:hypothetical protein BASA50_002031 [Batrachochytrium salamandrivorans]
MHPGGHNPVPENPHVYGIPGYLDQFQHIGAPPVQMGFPGGTWSGSSTDIPHSTWSCSIVDANASEFLTDAELCAMEGTLRNAIIPAIRNYWTDPGTTCWYCCPIQPNLAYATYRDSCG